MNRSPTALNCVLRHLSVSYPPTYAAHMSFSRAFASHSTLPPIKEVTERQLKQCLDRPFSSDPATATPVLPVPNRRREESRLGPHVEGRGFHLDRRRRLALPVVAAAARIAQPDRLVRRDAQSGVGRLQGRTDGANFLPQSNHRRESVEAAKEKQGKIIKELKTVREPRGK